MFSFVLLRVVCGEQYFARVRSTNGTITKTEFIHRNFKYLLQGSPY
jgi:hypothetical protein